jgi:hypothetical protein
VPMCPAMWRSASSPERSCRRRPRVTRILCYRDQVEAERRLMSTFQQCHDFRHFLWNAARNSGVYLFNMSRFFAGELVKRTVQA